MNLFFFPFPSPKEKFFFVIKTWKLSNLLAGILSSNSFIVSQGPSPTPIYEIIHPPKIKIKIKRKYWVNSIAKRKEEEKAHHDYTKWIVGCFNNCFCSANFICHLPICNNQQNMIFLSSTHVFDCLLYKHEYIFFFYKKKRKWYLNLILKVEWETNMYIANFGVIIHYTKEMKIEASSPFFHLTNQWCKWSWSRKFNWSCYLSILSQNVLKSFTRTSLRKTENRFIASSCVTKAICWN